MAGGPDSAAPPNDIAAEKIVLGAMMSSGAALADVIGLVGPQDYYRPQHQVIHAAITNLGGRGDPYDPVAVGNELERRGDIAVLGGKGRLYLIELIEAVPTAANAGYYAKIVADKAALRRLREIGERLVQAADSADTNAAEAHAFARSQLEIASRGAAAGGMAARLVPGEVILDEPATPPALWGGGEDVLWSEGESLIIAGPDGTGKTTLAGQVVKARLGIGAGGVLGMPVQPSARNVLYLMMDRPRQIRRALRRIFTEDNRDALKTRLVIWLGPPPADLARSPATLLELCKLADAGTVIVDSLKDAALKLSDDETGSGWNRARQLVTAAGVEIIELHHPRKEQADNKRPATLADLYGSRWISAGAGSVIMLWGKAGDPVVDLIHLKQPCSEVGPLKVSIDPQAGTVAVEDPMDLLEQIRLRGPNGITAEVAARLVFGKDKPTANEIKKAAYRLNRLCTAGVLYCRPGSRGGGKDREPSTWFRVAREQSETQSDSSHAHRDYASSSRPGQSEPQSDGNPAASSEPGPIRKTTGTYTGVSDSQAGSVGAETNQ